MALEHQAIQRKHRPAQWSEVVGQELAVRVLTALVRTPERIPSVIVLQGSFGSGKTTMARLLGRSLNCAKLIQRHEPCQQCHNCLTPLDEAPFYLEYDVSAVGSAEKARSLRDLFSTSIAGIRRVICLDEAHLASTEAQSAFLKVFEETPAGTTFVLCTTEGESLLATIRSRALEIPLGLVPADSIIANLQSIAAQEEIEVSERALRLIADRSRGHMRDAHKMLDLLSVVGEKTFLSVTPSAQNLFLRFFAACAAQDRETALDLVNRLGRISLADLQHDFHAALLLLVRASVQAPVSAGVRALADQIGPVGMRLVRLCLQEWVSVGFRTDVGAQATLLAIFALSGQSGGSQGTSRPQGGVSSSLMDRAQRR